MSEELCPNSGRIVSETRVKRSIYTAERGWSTLCPRCGRPASWAMAELRRTGAGYNKRWKEHPK